MSDDPIKSLYDWSNDGYDTQATPDQTATPDGFGETFRRGFDQGIEGVYTDTEYFKGLFNTVIGDDEAAAQNIATARQREAGSENAFGDLQNFEEFIENTWISASIFYILYS